MRFHELLARQLERAGVARHQQLVHRAGRQLATQHGVVNAFAGGRSHYAGCVTGQHHITPVVPAGQGLHGNRRAFAAQGFGVLQAGGFTQGTHGAAQGKALVGAAGADAQGVAVREDPAVKIRRQGALVKNIAARAVIAGRLDLGGAHDLVVRKHVTRALCTGHRLPGYFRSRTVCADHTACPHRCRHTFAAHVAFTRHVVHDAGAVGVAAQAFKAADPAHRTAGGSALTQPFVKGVAVDHADKAVVDGDVHVLA